MMRREIEGHMSGARGYVAILDTGYGEMPDYRSMRIRREDCKRFVDDLTKRLPEYRKMYPLLRIARVELIEKIPESRLQEVEK